jgi:hypothetical protein
MAVWGAPVANEDDAERAVRAALDLLDAIPELDPSLAARAGVLTGEAAVTVGASGEGIVAGDLVNTAARIQSAADAGTVLVGASSKRATEAAIAHQDAGSHELKGKREPVELWRALRVTAARRGALKAEGLEPPFVGRDRELRLIKELFHASADERRANLVSVVGIAGIGKSRLAWEFFKYVDGLANTIWWHRGRCLAYGDGVAYWALAEMVRMRAGIADTEAADTALAKLRSSIDEHITDPDEREWLEPRLAHLLGLAERTAPDKEDLFSALRLFFERLAEQTRRCSSSRTSSGRIHRCSTSSSTCWTGREATRCSYWRSHGPSWPSAGPAGARRGSTPWRRRDRRFRRSRSGDAAVTLR